ncbi:MAG: hypothetical protein PHF00_02965 [Elusimicrobia bacterium]|nr:hypothetical protein [Elusimicrobiota bacterium]
MFTFQKTKFSNKRAINIGCEVGLEGELVYGSPLSDFASVERLVKELETLAISDLIAINVSKLDRWDSLGITKLIGPIIKLNRKLAERGRLPVVIVGDKSSDNFRAVRDKFPKENNTEILPWYASLQAFLNSIER